MTKKMAAVETYSTKEAIDLIGRGRSTVLGWIHRKLIDDVGKDRKHERVWTVEDIERFKVFAEQQIDKRGKQKGGKQ